MGKNKKKRAQMFSNFLAFKAGQGNQNTNKNLIIVNKPLLPSILQNTQGTSFQTPHSDQEKLTELLDDNSPSVSSGPSQPSGKPIQTLTRASVSGTKATPAKTIGMWKPVDDTSNIQVNMRKDLKRPNLTVVEESASKIQLVLDKAKKVSAQPSSSPKPVEESKSNTPPLASVTGMPSAISLPKTEIGKPLPSDAQPIPLLQPNQPRVIYPAPAPAHQKEQKVTTGLNWVLAPHVNKTMSNVTTEWQPPKVSPQPNTGSGWPKVRQAQSQFPHQQNYNPTSNQTSPMDQINTDDMYADLPQAYSPSDVYSEIVNNEREASEEEADSSEMNSADTKRLSAFQRLGPVAEQPKTPKLTINLLCQNDVRNVVDESIDIPTHLRDYITSSTDEIVVKYADVWPFKKNIPAVRVATVRQAKSVMILETEYMEEAYVRDNKFILVTVTGYPQHWRKEDVLDAVLESVNGKSFIPCFIEFTRVQCKFLVIRSRVALLAIHKYGFIIRKEAVELTVSITNIHLSLNQLDFVPRLILRKLMSSRLDEADLNLSEFTLKNDISHFIYFPLHRVTNQKELMQLQSTVPWECLTTLNLSHNAITTLIGFDLFQTTPKLRHLNLSHNCIEKVTMLLQCRNLPLKSIHLEGNPLCNDYIEQEHYIKVLTMLFTGLDEIDGVPIKQRHPLPDAKRNYCPEDAAHIVDKVLEVMFPLLDASQEKRCMIEELYHEEAVMTITFMYKLRYSPLYKKCRNLFNRARVIDECDMESIAGPAAIGKVISRWPDMMHDPNTFTVDVLFHSDTTTIIRIGGIVKLTTESLADEEHLLSFTRTLVLSSKDRSRYKIMNELLYWDQPEREFAETAFQITMVKPQNLSLRLDAPPDDELKEKLLQVFMQLTELGKRPSERCLEAKEWNIKNALEYFTKLLKLDNLDPIMRDL